MRTRRWLAVAGSISCASVACVHAPAPQGVTHVLEAGQMMLACDPPDAEVSLDGVPMGLCSDYATAARGLPASNGMHRLAFRRAGRASQELQVEPDRAGAVVHVELAPLQPEKRP